MRVFAAIPLPESLRRDLAAVAAQLASSCRGVVPVRENALHVTLRFFGELGEGAVASLSRAFDPAAAGLEAFTAAVGGWGQFPPRGCPRVLFTRILRGQEMVRRLAEAYRAATDEVAGGAEDRPFAAHVTLARNKSARIGEGDGALVRFRRSLEERSTEVSIDEVHLYRSILGPRGPRYEILQVYRLAEEARE